MEELLDILNEIDDSIDYENEKALIDDHLLDSFSIITLVSEAITAAFPPQAAEDEQDQETPPAAAGTGKRA